MKNKKSYSIYDDSVVKIQKYVDTDILNKMSSSKKVKKMPKMVKPSSEAIKNPPIFTWTFKSSTPKMGGAVVQYITRLNDDGTVSCNCSGWIFNHHKKGQFACRHTNEIKDESVGIFKKWKAGDDEETMPLTIVGDSAPELKTKSPLPGRVIDLD